MKNRYDRAPFIGNPPAGVGGWARDPPPGGSLLSNDRGVPRAHVLGFL